MIKESIVAMFTCSSTCTKCIPFFNRKLIVVIDADDLLCDPEGIMKKYCAATRLPHKEGMSEWEPKMFPDWEKCSGNGAWHHDVAKSGFVRQAPPPVDGLPEVFRVVVDESLPLYEALYRVWMR